ncbi:hypothetical protein [Sphingomonas sp. Leaf33]|nr:hypothetical protein [Sphingomonas sp. Leaf33]
MTDGQTPQSQLDKFKQAARDLETDDDPKRFADRLGKLVKHKPVEKETDS